MRISEARAEIAELKRHIRHLEGRISGQKSTITHMQNQNTLWNTKVAARHQGRENLLRDLLRESQQSMYSWMASSNRYHAQIVQRARDDKAQELMNG